GLVQPQRRQFGRYRLPQPLRRRMPSSRKRFGSINISEPGFPSSLFEGGDVGGAGLQVSQTGRQRVQPSRQFPNGDAMLAGSGAQREQPLLRLLQQTRVQIGIGSQARQNGLGLGQCFLGPLQRGQRRFSRVLRLRLVVGHEALQRPGGGAQGGGGTVGPAVAGGEFGQGGGDRLAAPFVLLQALAFGGQRVLLIRL